MSRRVRSDLEACGFEEGAYLLIRCTLDGLPAGGRVEASDFILPPEIETAVERS